MLFKFLNLVEFERNYDAPNNWWIGGFWKLGGFSFPLRFPPNFSKKLVFLTKIFLLICLNKIS